MPICKICHNEFLEEDLIDGICQDCMLNNATSILWTEDITPNVEDST